MGARRVRGLKARAGRECRISRGGQTESSSANLLIFKKFKFRVCSQVA